MNDYILLMRDDGVDTKTDDWDVYLARLKQSGNFQGGSSIGKGIAVSKSGTETITKHLSGYIRISAMSLEEAQKSLNGNPVFESGGTVEIRELTRS